MSHPLETFKNLAANHSSADAVLEFEYESEGMKWKVYETSATPFEYLHVSERGDWCVSPNIRP